MNQAEISNLIDIGVEFCWVSNLISIDKNELTTSCFFEKNHDISKAHFKSLPGVVPASLLSEHVAQSLLLMNKLNYTMDKEQWGVSKICSSFIEPVITPNEVVSTIHIKVNRNSHIGFTAKSYCENRLIAKFTGVVSIIKVK